MATAPYCNVESANPKGDPGKGAKGTGAAGAKGALGTLPHTATNQQIISYINRLVNVIYPSIPTPSLPDPFTGFKTTNTGEPTWKEVKEARSVKVVRITNPEDSTQFVDVEQINGLTYKNAKTGEKWVWNR